jgi:hypothetical protein
MQLPIAIILWGFGAVVAQEPVQLIQRRKICFRRVCLGRNRAQGKRRKKFETITEVWKIAPSTQRIALRTSSQFMV